MRCQRSTNILRGLSILKDGLTMTPSCAPTGGAIDGPMKCIFPQLKVCHDSSQRLRRPSIEPSCLSTQMNSLSTAWSDSVFLILCSLGFSQAKFTCVGHWLMEGRSKIARDT